MRMDVELTDATGELQAVRQMQRGTLAEPLGQMHKVVTPDVVKDKEQYDSAQKDGRLTERVVHVPLSVTICEQRITRARMPIILLSSVKVTYAVWNKKTMAATGGSCNASCLQRGSLG